MKTQFTLLLFVLLALGACKKEVKMEAKKANTTEKEAHWNINLTYSILASTDPVAGKACTAFNDEISGLVNGIHAAFIEQAKEQIAGLDSAGIEHPAPYELLLMDSVYMSNERYISVLVQSYSYLGGANGNTDYYALNYDLKGDKFLTKNDLLDINQVDDINALLKAYLQDPDQCFTFDAPTLDNCSAVNITPDSIEFTYAKYILGPGACGPVTISIPREKLEGILKIKLA